MNQKIIKINKLGLLSALFFGAVSGWAQSGSFGNIYIFDGGQVTVHGGNQSFLVASSSTQPGVVGTDRIASKGHFALMDGTTWSNASNEAHVDGYVKTYQKGAFTFPIGDNGSYRPIAVSEASIDFPAEAAYFKANPNIAVTSSLKGGNEPVLPIEGPFSLSSKGADIDAVSTVEYWDINGDSPAKITLCWDTASNIQAFTGNVLEKLKIVGWDGRQWVDIPAQIDKSSLLGETSTLNNGSITTNVAFAPNTYSVYTLAGAGDNDVEVFNGITPNGDGDNEMLVIKGLEKYPDNTLEVFNRWGVKVYSTEKYGQSNNYFRGISEGRNTLQQDSGLPSGTYFYVLKYTNSNGVSKVKNGYLFLNR